jgi:hypothetical protein
MKQILFAGSLLLFLLMPSQAHAFQTLIGETITTTYLYPDTSTTYAGPVSTTVPLGGTTISDFAGFADINFSSSNILITTDRNGGPNPVSFDGFEFYDPDGIFGSVTLDLSSTYAGLTASDVTFSSDYIFVNVANLTGLEGQTILLDINATPEPPTVLLMATGLLLSLAVRRKLFAT